MKYEDLDVALDFFLAGVGDIVVQVAYLSDLHLIRHHIIEVFGTPSFNTGSRLAYNRKHITFATVDSWVDLVPSSNIFYVGRKDDSDLIKLRQLGINLDCMVN